jgi:hypothetical protein
MKIYKKLFYLIYNLPKVMENYEVIVLW